MMQRYEDFALCGFFSVKSLPQGAIHGTFHLRHFIENFADQFEDTDAATLSAETNFRELDEWSSLIALSVMAMIDEEYDVQLKGDEMRGANTIQELFCLVNSKL